MVAVIIALLGVCILGVLVLLVVAYGSGKWGGRESEIAKNVVRHLNGESGPPEVIRDIYGETAAIAQEAAQSKVVSSLKNVRRPGGNKGQDKVAGEVPVGSGDSAVANSASGIATSASVSETDSVTSENSQPQSF